jgi:hypothetical protein
MNYKGPVIEMYKKISAFLMAAAVIFAFSGSVFAERWFIMGRPGQTTGGGAAEAENLIPELFEDFENGFGERLTVAGAVSAEPSGTGDGNSARISGRGSLKNTDEWDNFTIETDVTYIADVSENGFLEWAFRRQSPDSNSDMYYILMNRTAATSYFSIRKTAGGRETILKQLAYAMSLNTKYKVKISCNNDTFDIYVNGNLFISAIDSDYEKGSFYMGTAHWGADASIRVDNLRIAPIPAARVSRVTLDSPDISIRTGELLRLPMNLEPFDAKDKSLILKTGNPEVVELGDYTVKGLKPGTATVTAVTNDGGYILKYNLTVTNPSFFDIQGHSRQSDIESLLLKDILKGGYFDGFRPDAVLTRGEAAAFAVWAVGYDVLRFYENYPDVSDGDPNKDYIRTAKKAGLFAQSLAENQNFRPSEPIISGDYLSLLEKAYSLATGKNLNMSDIINTNAQSEQNITRADAAALLLAAVNGMDSAGRLPVVPLDIEIELPDVSSGVVVNAADFGAVGFEPGVTPLSERFDNYDAITAALAYCKAVKARKLVFPPGNYYFKRGRIDISGFENFELDGQNSEFILGEAQQFFRTNNNKRFAMRNMVMDHDWETDPVAELFKITAKNGAEVNIEFLSRDSVTLEELPKIMGGGHILDRETLAFGADIIGQGETKRFEYVNAVKTGANTVSCTLTAAATYEVITVGDIIMRRYYDYQGHTFVINNSRDVTFDNITIYGGIGHGFTLGGNMEYWQIVNCLIGKRPGYELKRPISNATDGIHVAQSLGHYKIENCDIGYQGDDGVNVHEKLSVGIRYDDGDPYSLIATKASWATPVTVGGVVEIKNPDYTDTGFSAVVAAAVEDSSKGEIRMTFDKKVPVNLPSKGLVINRHFHSDWGIIRNNRFHHNRARGLLLKGNHILVEDNVFEFIQSSAMMIEFDVAWQEGYETSNVLVKNNTFDYCDVSEWENAVITVGAVLMSGKTEYPVNTNLVFEGNEFINPTGRLFRLHSFDGITIKDNKIGGVKERIRPNRPDRGVIFAELGKNITISGNVYEQSPLLPANLLDIQID